MDNKFVLEDDSNVGRKIKGALIIGAVIVVCGVLGLVLMSKFANNSIDSNWYMMVERSGIDGVSNKVYFYSDGKVIVDDSVNKYISQINKIIDLDEVYSYIMSNGSKEYIVGYKITLNKNSKTIRYISGEENEIEKFLLVIDRGMSIK